MSMSEHEGECQMIGVSDKGWKNKLHDEQKKVGAGRGRRDKNRLGPTRAIELENESMAEGLEKSVSKLTFKDGRQSGFVKESPSRYQGQGSRRRRRTRMRSKLSQVDPRGEIGPAPPW